MNNTRDRLLKQRLIKCSITSLGNIEKEREMKNWAGKLDEKSYEYSKG
jgi:hypothetical protein